MVVAACGLDDGLLYDIIAGRRDYRRLTRELFHLALLRKMSALVLRRVLRPVA